MAVYNKITETTFKEKINQLYGNKFKLIEFKSRPEKCTIKHKKCNNTFEMDTNEFTRKRTINRFLEDLCPKCRKQFEQKSSEIKTKNIIKNLTNNKIDLIDSFISTHDNAKFKCNICDKEFITEPHTLIQNVKRNKNPEMSFGCPYCSSKYKMTNKEFIDRINEIDSSYKILGKFINMHTKVKSFHYKCKKEYMIYPENFIYKNERCPCERDMIKSRQVKKIISILNENHIKYENEKRFKKCKDKKSLPFDFYLEEYNCIIEYDGSQHFNKKFYYEENYEIRHKHDLIKNEFCKNNSINLIRIPYKLSEEEIKNLILDIINEKDIEEYIDKYSLLTIINNKPTNFKNYYNIYKLNV